MLLLTSVVKINFFKKTHSRTLTQQTTKIAANEESVTVSTTKAQSKVF